MDIADDLMPRIAADALDALADDCGTQMPDMERFRHIRSAVIDDDLFNAACRLKPKFLRRPHPIQIIRHAGFGKLQIQETGRRNADFRKYGMIF